MSRIRNFLLTTLLGGFLVLLPLAILAMVVQLLLRIIRNLLAPLTNFLINEINLRIPDSFVAFLAFAIVVFLCFLMGLFVRTQMGSQVFSIFERDYLLRLPLYGTIKVAVQQFTGAKKMPFSEVVLVDVFKNGTRMTGFITDEHPSGNVTVFVPTGPNPTNGFIFHVRADQIERLSPGTKSEEALRTIIGIGVGSSDIMKF